MTDRIRPAREDDAALLPTIERSAAQSFQRVPGLKWITEGDVLDEAVHLGRIRGGTCWIAVDEHDTPIGFLSAEAIAECELHIYEMSVTETLQGHGVGRALLTAAIEWASAHHLTALTLTTFRDVPWNAPFYSRLGFKVLSASHLDTRLATLLRKEVEGGFAESTRCAMRLSLDDQASPLPLRNS
jgi:GNAT superfamily N-acetyltransferase